MGRQSENAAAFTKKVGKGSLPPIVVTRYEADRGEDLVARDRLVQAVTSAALEGASPIFGQTVFSAPTVTLTEVLEAAREVSLVAPRRLVLIIGSRLAAGETADDEDADTRAADREPPPRGKSRDKKGDEGEIAQLAPYLERAADASCIVFAGCPWDARRSIHKAVLQAAHIVDVSRPDLRDMPGWIERCAAEAGARIESEAAELIAELRGNDTLRVQGEIEKLRLHAGPSATITRKDVVDLLGSAEGTSAWTLVDAMADGDAARALKNLRRLLDDGEPLPILVGAIASRLRQLIVLSEEGRTGRPHEAARAIVFPGRSIYFARSLAQKAGRFPPSALVEALAALYDVDKRSKSSSVAGGAYLEQWLVTALKAGGSVRS